LSQPELFIELIRIVKPSFKTPANQSTLSKNIGEYKKSENNGGSYFESVFESDYDIGLFNERLKNDNAATLSQMAALTSRFIEDDKAEWLVKALVEVISKDSDIPSEKLFNIGNRLVARSDIHSITEVSVPHFLLSVWEYIVNSVRDNTVGKDTFAQWHEKKGEAKSEWVFKSKIGSEITQKIIILPVVGEDSDPPENVQVFEEASSYDEETDESFEDAETVTFVEVEPIDKPRDSAPITINQKFIQHGGLNIGYVGTLVNDKGGVR
jgi:hypothetical protein